MTDLLLPSNWNFFGQSKTAPSTPTPKTPQSPVAFARTWDVERDTDALFRANSVTEIKRIEQQTKLDIDRRREDLRQMVGERYRDLIDAADSIVEMKACSEEVLESVSKMERLCQKIQQTHFLRGSGGMRGPPMKNTSHEVALQMKILSETPEKIWLCLEQRIYLRAAHYYLLARHIHTQLGLAVRESGSNSAMIEKLWHSVVSFKDTILECCSRHLECSDGDSEDGPVIESLCAMVLLEGCSPRQVFAKFLVARKTAIQHVLRPGSHRSIKTQVCQLVETMLHSLLQIATIFSKVQSSSGSAAGCSLLLQKLMQFTDQHHVAKSSLIEELLPAELILHLPHSIATFVPSLRHTSLSEIPVNDIHSSTEDWIGMCQSDIESGVTQLLQHVTSIKGLASIKLAVYELLKQSPKADEGRAVEELIDWEDEWYRVCERVVGHRLCLWDMFFRGLLLKRAEAIIEKLSMEASRHATSQLKELLTNLASNPTLYQADTHSHAYLWQEDQAGGGASNRVGGVSSGGQDGINTLSLKAKSCTPSVYSFCHNLGVELDTLIQDVSHYFDKEDHHGVSTTSTFSPLSTSAIVSVGSTTKSRTKDSFPFTLYGDTTTLQEYLQQSTSQCITRFLQGVQDMVSSLQDEMSSTNQQGLSPGVIDRLLLVGRVCHCLFECCPSLSLLAAGCRTPKQSTINSTWFSGKAVAVNRQHSYRKEVDTTKTAIADMLQHTATSIFMLWAEWCANQFVDHFQDHLLAEMELNSLASTLVWDEITISEEDETGKQVSSLIRVPSQTSVYVTSLLFALSQEISRVGGHTIDKSILANLSSCVFQGVIKCYQNVLQKPPVESTTTGSVQHFNIPQQCALQLLFNLKFLSNVLVPQSENESKQLSGLEEELEGFVDPFDLDVFRPYISANLDRQLMRSTVLLGIFLAVKANPISTSLYKPPTTTQQRGNQEKHIVLPLAPSVGRIASLPTSSSNLRNHNSHQVSPSPLDLKSSSFLLETLTFFHHL